MNSTDGTMNTFNFIDFVKEVMEFSEDRLFVLGKSYELDSGDLPKFLEYAKELQIVPENVFRYLSMKYKPIEQPEGVRFEAKCIQLATPFLVVFGISELHKVLTDLNYVTRFTTFNQKLEIRFNQIRLEYPDRVLYSLWLKSKGVESPVRDQKVPTWDYILGIKKRAVKRKWCRIYMYLGYLNYRQFREIMNNVDFSPSGIQNLKSKYDFPNFEQL